MNRETYVPKPEDIAWATMMVSLLKNGAVWGHPEVGAIYRIDHTAKTLTLVDAEPVLFCRPDRYGNAAGAGHEAFARTKAVFAEIGYAVRVDTEALAAVGIRFDKEELA